MFLLRFATSNLIDRQIWQIILFAGSLVDLFSFLTIWIIKKRIGIRKRNGDTWITEGRTQLENWLRCGSRRVVKQVCYWLRHIEYICRHRIIRNRLFLLCQELLWVGNWIEFYEIRDGFSFAWRLDMLWYTLLHNYLFVLMLMLLLLFRFLLNYHISFSSLERVPSEKICIQHKNRPA